VAHVARKGSTDRNPALRTFAARDRNPCIALGFPLLFAIRPHCTSFPTRVTHMPLLVVRVERNRMRTHAGRVGILRTRTRVKMIVRFRFRQTRRPSWATFGRVDPAGKTEKISFFTCIRFSRVHERRPP